MNAFHFERPDNRLNFFHTSQPCDELFLRRRAAIQDDCRGLVRREFFINLRGTAPIIAEVHTKIDRGLRSLASTHSIGGLSISQSGICNDYPELPWPERWLQQNTPVGARWTPDLAFAHFRSIVTFTGSKPTVEQKLAAVRMLFDFLVVRQVPPLNQAHAVRGPKYVFKKGKTSVWSREEAKTLLDSIPKDSPSGLAVIPREFASQDGSLEAQLARITQKPIYPPQKLGQCRMAHWIYHRPLVLQIS